jgi:hypothetical protein
VALLLRWNLAASGFDRFGDLRCSVIQLRGLGCRQDLTTIHVPRKDEP